ncbi:MAG: chemotaxis protein CheW [Deltaproteobacteria bacterium]|nr:chemotaxis protein CheW [Deltaproteobacteria bacterium]
MKKQAHTPCVMCRVGQERIAVPVADVYKVLPAARACRMPRLPAAIIGITHHRGRIITAVDPGALLFGVAGGPAGIEARLLILDRGQRHLALAVDAVEQIEPIRLGADLPDGQRPGLKVAEHRGKAVFAVDTDRLVASVLAL